MKKISFLTLVGLSILSAACKKNRICSCYLNDLKYSSYTIEEAKKKDANVECSKNNIVIMGQYLACELE